MQADKDLLVSTLRNLPVLIKGYLVQIPHDKFDIKRNDTAWTIREHLYHVVGVQPMFAERIALIRDNPNPRVTAYTPTKEAEEKNKFASIEEALERYTEARGEQLDLLAGLSSEDLLRGAEHPEYKEYGMAILLNHMIFHEYWHMYRMEEIWLMKDEFFS